jgi:hypothetical protein
MGLTGGRGDRSLGNSLGGLAGECLGQHEGSDQGANLGDGNGGRTSLLWLVIELR